MDESFDDEFDFGGDALAQPSTTTKVHDSLDDDDLDLYPVSKPAAAVSGMATVVADDRATATIINLRASMQEKDEAIKQLKESLEAANSQLKKWADSVAEAKIVEGEALTAGPVAVVEAFSRIQEREALLQEQLVTTRRREALLLMKMANVEEEAEALRAEAVRLNSLMTPSPLAETRTLLLDPAIHAEFTFLKSSLESSQRRVKELQDDLAAVQFTPHSKNGKMLMAKCRTLQQENEEIGREAAEGKVHELENKLAMQRQINGELKRGYQDLKDLVDDMNEEAEQLQEQIYKLQRLVRIKEGELQDFRQKYIHLRRQQQGGGTSGGGLPEGGRRLSEGGSSRGEREKGGFGKERVRDRDREEPSERKRGKRDRSKSREFTDTME